MEKNNEFGYYDEDKFSSYRDYVKKLIEHSFGKENKYSGSASWGGIPVWTVKGGLYEGTFIGLGDNDEIFLIERKYDEKSEENVDTEIMTTSTDVRPGTKTEEDEIELRKIIKKAKEIKEKSMEKGGLTPRKARMILHDGKVHGHPITDKQRRFFGAISNGYPLRSKHEKGGLAGRSAQQWYEERNKIVDDYNEKLKSLPKFPNPKDSYFRISNLNYKSKDNFEINFWTYGWDILFLYDKTKSSEHDKVYKYVYGTSKRTVDGFMWEDAEEKRFEKGDEFYDKWSAYFFENMPEIIKIYGKKYPEVTPKHLEPTWKLPVEKKAKGGNIQNLVDKLRLEFGNAIDDFGITEVFIVDGEVHITSNHDIDPSWVEAIDKKVLSLVKYTIISEDGTAVERNVSDTDVIDYANKVGEYERRDQDAEEISNIQDAIRFLKLNYFTITEKFEKGGLVKTIWDFLNKKVTLNDLSV